MTQVSKRPVEEEVWERIFDIYLASLTSLSKKELEAFFEDFYTPTEKIMFAKRFACAVLLVKGKDYKTIMDTLKITPPTVAKISMHIKYSGRGLMPAVKKALNKQSIQVVIEELKDFIDLPKKQIFSSARLKRHYERERKISRIKSTL